MWIAVLWAKAWKYLAALGALVAAVATVYLSGRSKGKSVAEQASAARDAQANAQVAQQVIHAHEVRNEVEADNSQLPDAPPQRVETADSSTAAGKLRDDGWVRD